MLGAEQGKRNKLYQLVHVVIQGGRYYYQFTKKGLAENFFKFIREGSDGGEI